jgi:membrane-associated protease RseP (regulator of RpoE activity)
MTLPETEIFTSIVSRVFRVDEVTHGDPKQGYFLRYRGELTQESAAAYDQLSTALQSYEITPLFRVQDGRQTVLLVRGIIHPKVGRASINILFFVLTFLSVLFTGAVFSYQGPLPDGTMNQIWTIIKNMWVGWPFAASLLSILLAHEFGHYFVGRARGAAVSLPYFLPLPYPISPLGTLGAFIQLKQLPRNRRALFDLAVAGPLAGMVIAVPLLALGLTLSPVGVTKNTTYTKTVGVQDACPNTASVGQTYTCPLDDMLEGNSLLYLGMKYLVKGQLLPAPVSYNMPPLLYWIRYFFTGQPIPIGGLDVMIHPVAWAAWAGLLVTFLNLIPVGQLDGGHILYSLFGKRVQVMFPVILVVLVAMGFFWAGWWLWAFLIFLFGRSHAEPLDQITRLDTSRKVLAVVVLIIFLLVLTPIPLLQF